MLDHLDQFEFCHLRLRLDLLSAVTFPRFGLLRLRRDLRRSAHDVLGETPVFRSLFDPPLAADPVGVRRYQRPGPAFVLAMPELEAGTLEAGDSFTLDCRLFGQGIRAVDELLCCLAELGRRGLWQGAGRFEVGALEAIDGGGQGHRLPISGAPLAGRLPLVAGTWYLDSRPQTKGWRLTFSTPARLLAEGRPLFRAGLRQLIPFILRRVTSMAYAHCGVELVPDPQALLTTVAGLRILEERLAWCDWRRLERQQGNFELGGLCGSSHFVAEDADDLLAVLHLGSLFGVGRNAGYGAGRYLFEPLAESG